MKICLIQYQIELINIFLIIMDNILISYIFHLQFYNHFLIFFERILHLFYIFFINFYRYASNFQSFLIHNILIFIIIFLYQFFHTILYLKNHIFFIQLLNFKFQYLFYILIFYLLNIYIIIQFIIFIHQQYYIKMS